jgi:hypothetical protein
MAKHILASPYKITEVELVWHSPILPLERPQIDNSAAAYRILFDTWNIGQIDLQEHFKIMLLDQRKGCLGISTLASGCMNTCCVDIRLAFATALKGRAVSMILAHNHPSGQMIPSAADKELTYRFAIAGDLLNIPIADHIIVTRDGYYSFADARILGIDPLDTPFDRPSPSPFNVNSPSVQPRFNAKPSRSRVNKKIGSP